MNFRSRSLHPLLVTVVIALLGSGSFGQGDPLAGSWQGTIRIPNSPLDVSITLAAEDGRWSGAVDIPAQGASGLPLEDVRVEEDAVSFAIAGVPGAPTFDGTLAGDAIEGTFTQGGQGFPFRLTRADGTDANAADGAEGAATDAPVPPAPAAPPGPTPAPEAAETYEGPEGRFTVPVPTNWSVEERDGFAVLTSPEEGIRVYVVASRADDVEAGIDQAWERVDPAFDLEPEQTQEPPATGGLERVVAITYDTPSDDRIVQAVGRLHQGTVYTLLIDAQLSAVQRRASQIGIVNSGFTITAITEDDLTGERPRELTPALLGEFGAYVEEALQRFGVPGAAVSVVQDGRIVYSSGFGTKGGPTDEPVTPATRMMIGSTTKTMTTMLMAALVDEGRLSWDTPVVDVLPSFELADPARTEAATVQDLVCACTGVPRRDLELVFELETLTAEGIVASLRDFEFFTEVGEAFQYSNQMVATGGYAAAAAGGADPRDLYDGYVRLMHEHVLDPMGLAYSTFSFDAIRESGAFATPHGFDRDLDYEPIPLGTEAFVTPVAPAGALWSNVLDMGRYLVTLLGEGTSPAGIRVVSSEALRHTWEPQVPISADASYGLGWIVDEYKGLRQLHHGGNTMGFTSDLAFLPEAGIGVSVLTNARLTNPFNEAVRYRLFELVYGLEHEADAQATFGYENLRTAYRDLTADLGESVDEEVVAPWTGTYANPDLGEIRLSLQEGNLLLDAGAFEVELLPAPEEGEYVAVDAPLFGSTVRLADAGDGNASVVIGEGVAEYTFGPVD